MPPKFDLLVQAYKSIPIPPPQDSFILFLTYSKKESAHVALSDVVTFMNTYQGPFKLSLILCPLISPTHPDPKARYEMIVEQLVSMKDLLDCTVPYHPEICTEISKYSPELTVLAPDGTYLSTRGLKELKNDPKGLKFPWYRGGKSSFLESLLLGGIAALTAKMVSHPLTVISTMGIVQRRNPFAIALERTKNLDFHLTQSMMSLLIHYARYFPTQALNFAFKDGIKKALKPKKGDAMSKFGFTVLSGGLAGMISLLFTYPLDRTAIRLSSGKFSSVGEALSFKSIPDLYNGFSVAVGGIFIYRGIYFGMYDIISKKFMKPTKDKDGKVVKRSYLQKFLLAQGVITTALVVTEPLNSIRIRMICGETFSEAIQGNLLQGVVSNAFRSVASAVALVGYDMLRSYATKKAKKEPSTR
jgi:solute carrier family 25 (adenine nucleotide translocator) protein 4/5/6/31